MYEHLRARFTLVAFKRGLIPKNLPQEIYTWSRLVYKNEFFTRTASL